MSTSNSCDGDAVCAAVALLRPRGAAGGSRSCRRVALDQLCGEVCAASSAASRASSSAAGRSSRGASWRRPTQARVDRKTARSYVDAAVAAGLDRDGGVCQLDDELIGTVVAAVRPDRPQGYGAAWEALCANHDRISTWVKDGLTVVKIGDLLARQGGVVPARTLHRYCAQRTEYRGPRWHGAGGRRGAWG